MTKRVWFKLILSIMTFTPSVIRLPSATSIWKKHRLATRLSTPRSRKSSLTTLSLRPNLLLSLNLLQYSTLSNSERSVTATTVSSHLNLTTRTLWNLYRFNSYQLRLSYYSLKGSLNFLALSSKRNPTTFSMVSNNIPNSYSQIKAVSSHLTLL